MPLQTSGAISLSQIAAEYGDSQPHSLSEFYAGGSAGVSSGGAPNVPSSGEISFDDFYGASNQVTVTISSNATNQNVSSLFGSNFSANVAKLLVINSNVELGATSLSNYALQVPSGMGGTLNIQNSGTISGAGGDGSSSGAGGDGGTALYIASSNVTVTNTGTIRGGGGGGGRGADGTQGGVIVIGRMYCFSGAAGQGGAGGNGQGYDQSQSNGSAGTSQGNGSGMMPFCAGVIASGGNSTAGSSGGNGGSYGNNGSQGGGGGSAGGSAGKYIELSGVSYTLSNSGSLQGNAP